MRGAPAVLLLLTLSACGGQDQGDQPTPPTVTSPSSTSTRATTPATTRVPTPVATAPAQSTDDPPTFTSDPPTSAPTEPVLSDRLQEYMLRLEVILPEITNDASEAITRGEAVCRRVKADVTYFELLQITKDEFGGPNSKPLNDEQAAGVYEVIRDQLCPA